MITGITHEEDGTQVKVTKYRGKISAGYAPGEGPNKGNYPQASGFFRMLKEITHNKLVGTKKVVSKEWVLNEKAQALLEQSLPNPNKMPRRIEIVSLYKTAQEMWESAMTLYSGSEGLLCKSHGKGTPARQLKFDPSGNREWILREFDGIPGCAMDECPDKKAKKCKPTGLLKCFPVIDMTPNPYRFETGSINTIIGIESSLNDMENLLRAAHAVRELEAKKRLHYDGFFGAKLYLVHKKAKSGGRDIFVTDIMPTEEFTESVMEPIKRGMADKAKSAKMIGAGTSMTALEDAGARLIGEVDAEDVVPLDIEDEKEMGKNFNPEAQEETASQEIDPVSTLLNDDKDSPEK